MLKIAICEDNSIHARHLCELLEMHMPLSYEVSVFSSAQNFCASCQEKQLTYDIIFMDIELNSQTENGITLAQNINRVFPHPQIIFISQYLEYASSVYETEHIYFINKEQMDIFLPKALNTAIKNLADIQNQYLYFQQKKSPCQVLQSDILYMERVLRSTSIYIRTQKEPFITSERLSSLLDRLSPVFVLCHRSYAVNLKAVCTFNRDQITLFDGRQVPMGRSHYEQFKKDFAKLN